MYRILSGLAFGAFLLLGTPALAEPVVVGKPLTFVVRYSDLDVTHEEGARVLLSRLRHAARSVCSPAAGAEDLYNAAIYDGCLTTAMDRAVTDVHLALVSDLYGGETRATIAER